MQVLDQRRGQQVDPEGATAEDQDVVAGSALECGSLLVCVGTAYESAWSLATARSGPG
jgi:hypothetical protein